MSQSEKVGTGKYNKNRYLSQCCKNIDILLWRVAAFCIYPYSIIEILTKRTSLLGNRSLLFHMINILCVQLFMEIPQHLIPITQSKNVTVEFLDWVMGMRC